MAALRRGVPGVRDEGPGLQAGRPGHDLRRRRLSSLFGALLARRSARQVRLGPVDVGRAHPDGRLDAVHPARAGSDRRSAAAFLIAQQLVGDGGATVFEINQVSLRQSVTPERMLGRVNAAIRLTSLAAMLIGFADRRRHGRDGWAAADADRRGGGDVCGGAVDHRLAGARDAGRAGGGGGGGVELASTRALRRAPHRPTRASATSGKRW